MILNYSNIDCLSFPIGIIFRPHPLILLFFFLCILHPVVDSIISFIDYFLSAIHNQSFIVLSSSLFNCWNPNVDVSVIYCINHYCSSWLKGEKFIHSEILFVKNNIKNSRNSHLLFRSVFLFLLFSSVFFSIFKEFSALCYLT
jgi:hypothetical protein